MIQMRANNVMKLTIDSHSSNESFSRTAVGAFISQLDPTVEEISDIKTAVSEGVTNCIVHAYRDGIGKIYITVELFESGKVRIKIKDRGCGIPDIKKAMEPLFYHVGWRTGGPRLCRDGNIYGQSDCQVQAWKRYDGDTYKAVEMQGLSMISATDKNDSTVEENLGLVHSCANKFRGRESNMTICFRPDASDL